VHPPALDPKLGGARSRLLLVHLLSTADLRVRHSRWTRAALLVHQLRATLPTDVTITSGSRHADLHSQNLRDNEWPSPAKPSGGRRRYPACSSMARTSSGGEVLNHVRAVWGRMQVELLKRKRWRTASSSRSRYAVEITATFALVQRGKRASERSRRNIPRGYGPRPMQAGCRMGGSPDQVAVAHICAVPRRRNSDIGVSMRRRREALDVPVSR
jgi:hypothetical protein